MTSRERFRLAFQGKQPDKVPITEGPISKNVVAELFSCGCDIVTMPVEVFESMFHRPLTESGLKKFGEDWQAVAAASKSS